MKRSRFSPFALLALAGASSLALAKTAPMPQTASAGGPRFAIKRFQVQGGALVPAGEIDAALAPFVGPSREFSEVAVGDMLTTEADSYTPRSNSATAPKWPCAPTAARRWRNTALTARAKGAV